MGLSISLNSLLNKLPISLDFSNISVARSISAFVDETIIKQDYLGGYIEIQPDSYDGNPIATDSSTNTWGFPTSLLPSERERIKNTLLKGDGKNIMYIRFPLGFAYRGFRNIDSGNGLSKNIGERFQGQNSSLKQWFQNIANAGGGLAPEYWCPAPFWVTSGSYSGNNQLAAGGSYPQTTTLASIKLTDSSQYSAQINAFTNAIIDDLEYLHQNIAPVRMFGLQNEPQFGQENYGGCSYDSQTYNDVLEVLYPKIQASEILSVFNDEKNEVKLHVASCLDSPFTGIAATFIANHSDWIWGYSHHQTRMVSGESYSDGADWYKTSDFNTMKGTKSNVFMNEYEYFDNNFGTDDFRCSNSMLHLINESVYGGAQVLHPIIHICKPIGQTLYSTNTRGYCLFAANMKDEYGIDISADSNTYGLNKGTSTPNTPMYNQWAMFGDNLPVGAYLVGDYAQITRAGYCVYKYNGKLYIFLADSTSTGASITLTFSDSKSFNGKFYDATHCGDSMVSKSGNAIEFKIPPYSGQAWIEQ